MAPLTPRDIRAVVITLLKKRKDVANAGCRGGVASWLLLRQGWVTLVWMEIVPDPLIPGVIRFKNNVPSRVSKQKWPHSVPDYLHLDLAAVMEEVNAGLLQNVIDHCERARKESNSIGNPYNEPFTEKSPTGGGGWSLKAVQAYQTGRQVQEPR